jgi:hypothetical protein
MKVALCAAVYCILLQNMMYHSSVEHKYVIQKYWHSEWWRHWNVASSGCCEHEINNYRPIKLTCICSRGSLCEMFSCSHYFFLRLWQQCAVFYKGTRFIHVVIGPQLCFYLCNKTLQYHLRVQLSTLEPLGMNKRAWATMQTMPWNWGLRRECAWNQHIKHPIHQGANSFKGVAGP